MEDKNSCTQAQKIGIKALLLLLLLSDLVLWVHIDNIKTTTALRENFNSSKHS